jgi:hypothetical protein
MNKLLSDKVRAQIIAQATQALDESWTMIEAAMSQAAFNAAQAGNDTLKFPVALKATLEPCGDDCNVGLSVSFGTRARLTIDKVSVSTQPELPMRERT